MELVTAVCDSSRLVADIILAERANAAHSVVSRSYGNRVVGPIHNQVGMIESLTKSREEVKNMSVIVQKSSGFRKSVKFENRLLVNGFIKKLVKLNEIPDYIHQHDPEGNGHLKLLKMSSPGIFCNY